MTRRSFLKIIATTAVVCIIPSIISNNHKFQIFTLYGDGVTDDTEALQAMFDGKDVFFNGKLIQNINGVITVPDGTFKVENTIKIK